MGHGRQKAEHKNSQICWAPFRVPLSGEKPNRLNAGSDTGTRTRLCSFSGDWDYLASQIRKTRNLQLRAEKGDFQEGANQILATPPQWLGKKRYENPKPSQLEMERSSFSGKGRENAKGRQSPNQQTNQPLSPPEQLTGSRGLLQKLFLLIMSVSERRYSTGRKTDLYPRTPSDGTSIHSQIYPNSNISSFKLRLYIWIHLVCPASPFIPHLPQSVTFHLQKIGVPAYLEMLLGRLYMCMPIFLGVALSGQTFNLSVLINVIHISDKELTSRKK